MRAGCEVKILSELEEKVAEAVALLGEKSSAKRRSGAKRLRKLKDSSAGAALLAALREEVRNPRTWETQYHMIMALGECGYAPALPFVQELAARPFEATMVYVALGDALVRLGRASEDDIEPARRAIETENHMLIEGALRAVAMLRLKPDEAAVSRIIDYAARLGANDSHRFWVSVAAAGWDSPEVSSFLLACAGSPREDIRQAAVAARQQKYLKVNPL